MGKRVLQRDCYPPLVGVDDPAGDGASPCMVNSEVSAPRLGSWALWRLKWKRSSVATSAASIAAAAGVTATGIAGAA